MTRHGLHAAIAWGSPRLSSSACRQRCGVSPAHRVSWGRPAVMRSTRNVSAVRWTVCTRLSNGSRGRHGEVPRCVWPALSGRRAETQLGDDAVDSCTDSAEATPPGPPGRGSWLPAAAGAPRSDEEAAVTPARSTAMPAAEDCGASATPHVHSEEEPPVRERQKDGVSACRPEMLTRSPRLAPAAPHRSSKGAEGIRTQYDADPSLLRCAVIEAQTQTSASIDLLVAHTPSSASEDLVAEFACHMRTKSCWSI